VGVVKALVISLAVGIVVGVLYALLKVKSPAPPIVALVGLLGIVIGEHLLGWIRSLAQGAAQR
jgi:XapX domain-containing protein